jgi:DNA mismatch repair protein MutS
MKDQTPLMKQYWEIKEQHPDKILFFRMGDFFELFYDDAVTAAPLVGLTLTQRNKKAQDTTPMCGLPHHAIANPINKLLSYGYKVALCDQLEDPKFAKGLVKRGVTRILTPGMVFDPDSLDGGTPHYMGAFLDQELAIADPSTGEAFYFKHLNGDQLSQVKTLYPIVEWVFSDPKQAQDLGVSSYTLFSFPEVILSPVSPNNSARELLRQYLMTLVGGESEILVHDFDKRSFQTRMKLNPQCFRHLEIFENYTGEKRGSLFASINKTQTSMGARLLRQWLTSPLTDYDEILRRQQQILYWFQENIKREEAILLLKQVGDIERRLSRVVQSHSNARDLQQLVGSLKLGIGILEIRGKFYPELKALCSDIDQTLCETLPVSVKQGYLINKGVCSELDEYIDLSSNSQELLLQMEARERQQTQIPSLKIRYNQVFGYYIEVTHTHKNKVPSHYLRKQTLAQSERYYTEELVQLEKKILSAEAKRFELEYHIFEKQRNALVSFCSEIRQVASLVAEVDLCAGASRLIIERSYSLPEFHQDSRIHLESCRHPVVETTVSFFVPNTISMDQGQVLLVTGPNMAGKSTLMRQVALNVLLAQIGFPVACKKAMLPLLDGLFTRIGASDHLSEGLSTFMVEMKESSYILKNYQSRSLLILDEIGRGTSTYDGLSLARAILESILEKQKGYTFFATHYHELTDLHLPYFQKLRHVHMSIQELDTGIEFLHTLKEGPAHKSYGLYVAQLAGLPSCILKKAKAHLNKLEKIRQSQTQMTIFESLLPLSTDGDESEEKASGHHT